MACDLSAPDKY
jgi:hypothetical protein